MTTTEPEQPLLVRAARHGEAIEARLNGLLDRVRRRFLVHGLGWMVAAIAAGLVVYYALDRVLDLPAAVRLVLSVALVLFLAAGFRRRLLYPLRKKLVREDLAIAVERRFPALQQRLISALQFAQRARHEDARGESEAMIAAVVDDAAQELESLRPAEILDPRRTTRVWSIAVAFALVSGVTLLADLDVTRAFFARMLGVNASYPRLTHLHVELPKQNDEIQVSLGEETADVLMPSGGDLPVIVVAEGSVPREVRLITRGGRGVPGEITTSPRGEGRFRHVFRRVQSDFEFHARGGDDPYGDLTVRVRVVEPPRVATISAVVTYPPYTGREPTRVVGGSIEALVGSTAAISVSATAEVTRAHLHLLDAGTRIELTPQTLRDDSGVSTSYAGTIRVEDSDRYQVEFVGTGGVRNPNPGTYPIRATKDHEPIAELVSPTDDELNVSLPTALLPIRVTAADDFGIASIRATTTATKGTSEDEHTEPRTLFERSPSDESPAPTETTVGAVVEIRELSPDPVSVGDLLIVSGTVTDVCEPTAQSTELGKRHIHIVGPTDLSRRITSHFRRIRESVEKALEIQESRQGQLTELRAGGADAEARHSLVMIEVGQGRVMTETRRLRRELMRSFDVHLFNRLEESLNAPKVVDLYTRFHRENPTDEATPVAFYREVATARNDGSIGPMEKTLDPILGMITAADELASDLCPRAVEEIERAQVDASAKAEALERVAALQVDIVDRLQALRGQLDEWNEFQDVISQTRSIRDKQRDLRVRTETIQRGTK